MKRKSAVQLVSDAVPAKSGESWFEQFGPTNQLYVQDVVREIIANPEAALITVAKALILELKIDRSATTVAGTLREMIRDAQKKA